MIGQGRVKAKHQELRFPLNEPKALLTEFIFKGWGTDHKKIGPGMLFPQIEGGSLPGGQHKFLGEREPQAADLLRILAAMFGGIVGEEEEPFLLLAQQVNEA